MELALDPGGGGSGPLLQGLEPLSASVGQQLPVLHGAAPAPGTPRITTGQNTTIAVVATDAVITKAQAKRLATCAHDGLARAIRPVHTQMDGDTIFALGTGRVDADVNQIQLCAAAAEVMARAVVNAVAMGRDA